jgi:hypothetical protein
VWRDHREGRPPDDARGRLGSGVQADLAGNTRRREVGLRRLRPLLGVHLLIVCTAIFLASWAGHSFTGWTEYNRDQAGHGESAVSWAEYVQRPTFWEQTFQNWQSEFLVVGSLAVFAVYLRARGATESKPVGTPHDSTGVSN